ncbi:MbnP family protein [Chitinophaga lutea]
MRPYFLPALLLLAACSKDPVQQQGTMQLEFKNVVNGAALQLNTGTYQNTTGESFSISTFKYYISNISLTRMDNTQATLPAEYFLVDESKAASKVFSFAVPKGEYRSISFLIGVDSTRNVSGAQTGALDVVNGMFWSWNSGYIMAKLEGKADVSAQPDHALTFHVGGFAGQYKAVQPITLVFPISVVTGHDRKPEITITADAYKWFSQPYTVSFKDQSAIHVPGEAAWKMSENYRNMFRIINVTDL